MCRALSRGAYVAAIGTILGPCVPPGTTAIGDWLTALIAADSLAVLFHWRLSNTPGRHGRVIGVIVSTILQPTWVLVK